VNRNEPGVWLVAAATLAGLATGPFACSSSENLAGAGGSCIQVTDCQDGLVCGKGPNGTGVCTSNTGSLEPPQDAGGGVDAPSAPQSDAASSGDATQDSTTPTDDAPAPEDEASAPEDAEVPDVEQHPMDSGKPEEAAAPPVEASAPPPDAGVADAKTD
jgi:hypothetical protein